MTNNWTDSVKKEKTLNFSECSHLWSSQILTSYTHFNISAMPKNTVGNQGPKCLQYCQDTALNVFKYSTWDPFKKIVTFRSMKK
jgi:hypothetical protein